MRLWKNAAVFTCQMHLIQKNVICATLGEPCKGGRVSKSIPGTGLLSSSSVVRTEQQMQKKKNIQCVRKKTFYDSPEW